MSTEKNKLWCFGDSFTYGSGCIPESEYYQQYPKERKKLWTTIVAEQLNLIENNLAYPGNGPAVILKQILTNLPYVKKKDIVVFSSSKVDRIPLPDLNPYIPSDSITSVFPSVVERYPFKKVEGKRMLFNNKKESEVFLDFFFTHIVPFEKEWNKFYCSQFTGLTTTLNLLGIECYYWDYRIWDKKNLFQTINDLKKPGIEDGHWSWKGHRDFATYLLERIENKEYI